MAMAFTTAAVAFSENQLDSSVLNIWLDMNNIEFANDMLFVKQIALVAKNVVQYACKFSSPISIEIDYLRPIYRLRKQLLSRLGIST